MALVSIDIDQGILFIRVKKQHELKNGKKTTWIFVFQKYGKC